MTGAMAVLAVSFLPFFEAKNDAANFILSPPAEGATEAKAAEKPSLMVVEKCPICGGTGEIVLQEQDFGQASGRIGKLGSRRLKCDACRGAKRIERYVDLASLAAQVAKDREKFESTHLAKGDIPVGEAFVPRESYKDHDKRLKLVEKAYGKACRTCNWTGVEACKKCSGQGVRECPNKDCKGGWAVTSTTTSVSRSKSGGSNRSYSRGFNSGSSRRYSRKETKVSVQVCPDCGGAGRILCPDCGGRRAAPCRKCQGLGSRRTSY